MPCYSGDLEMTSRKKSKFNGQHESNWKSENVQYILAPGGDQGALSVALDKGRPILKML